MADTIVIVGAGLAGLAAATALAPRGFAVTLLESRQRLGGRASSFTDAGSGQVIDACQHVSMGCCTNFAHFCKTVGIDHMIQTQPAFHFMTPDRRVSGFQGDPLPAPFHLARAFLGAHFLHAHEKVRIIWGLACLRRQSADADEPFLDWLARHRQTPGTIERFWNVVLVSSLNETCDRLGLKYARKVFLDGFLRNHRGFQIEIPTVPLARLYGAELQSWLADHGVRLVLGQGAKQISIRAGRVQALHMRDGPAIEADWYVSAVPFDRLVDLLPAEVVEAEPVFANLRRLETSPITSVHLWYDRPITRLPHVVLLSSLGQWLFNRGEVAPGEHYVQVVVSAARPFRGLGHDEVRRRILDELGQRFPDARQARLVRGRVVTEQGATISVVPGVDRWRPAQASPIHNLLLAGDWTQTGWPGTMEGAVRSGYLAAQALLRRQGVDVDLVQPDL